MTNPTQQRPLDAAADNWVDRWAPAATRPYLRLMRADRPVGTWLLLWPCLWSIALAGACIPCGASHWSILKMMVLFAIGAFVMRSAGCIVNDMWDRDIDAKVARTAARPLASGELSFLQALVTLGILCSIGLLVLVQLPTKAIILGIASLPLVLLYPLAKRFTWWPQAVLGLVFNWGALLGWTAVKAGYSGMPAVLLYLGCIAWTIGYDTIYAHQDRNYDMVAGVKSSALRLGNRSARVIALLYTLALLFWGLAGWRAEMSEIFYLGLAACGAHFVWQVRSLDIDDGPKCLKLFKSNIQFGAIMLLAIMAGSHEALSL